ncbi:nucleic acid dioxygenase ALKBH1 [Protopterus annectens]|uniref:nucleic acid dioxygenase ALKBH1 n=1 Tax=Protopterus annectens TaxID=7888 RepID=UPI001CFADFB0|nr:nucleic acid dioxygenase ALKBH1 [Protopterus annectens]
MISDPFFEGSIGLAHIKTETGLTSSHIDNISSVTVRPVSEFPNSPYFSRNGPVVSIPSKQRRHSSLALPLGDNTSFVQQLINDKWDLLMVDQPVRELVGFIFISNPFLPWSQRYWVKQCLKMYPQKPNVCNLDMHMSPEETTDIWGKSMLHMRQKGSSKRESKCLLEKLRWVTLGYHYDWNTKTYSAEHYTPFPSDLAFLSEQVTAACGFQGFTAQAGILNYYHFDSSLGIHVDESELDHSKPLLSFSFGQSSIFLLGGLKREDMPIAMLMHSGDIMIMSGFSRLLYHAVPRIISNPEGCPVPRCLEPAICTDSVTADSTLWCDEADWEICASYLKNSRINMTVRQVLADGQVFPSSGNKTNVIQPGSYYSEDVNKEEYGAKREKTDEIVDVHTQIDS